MSIKIPEGAIYIIKSLNTYHFKAYLVGGCVRDMIIGREPHDWDICTNATPDYIKKIFPVTVDTGLKHGTVTVIKNDEQYEVTTFRKDGKYSDGRKPDTVEFVDDLTEDLARRDFTINAIAYDINTNNFIDPFNGTQDIKLKTIRCVGNSSERFVEDKLRIIRAIRFSCQLGFHINAHTRYGMEAHANELNSVSRERICSELWKIMESNCPYFLTESTYEKILVNIIPEFATCYKFNQHNPYHDSSLMTHIYRALYHSTASKDFDAVTRFAILFHDIAKPYCQTFDGFVCHYYGHATKGAEMTKEIMTQLRFDNTTINDVCQLIKYHDCEIAPTYASIRRWLNKIGEKQFRRLLLIQECDIKAQAKKYYYDRCMKLIKIYNALNYVIAEKSCFSLKDLAINGKDVMALGVPEGKIIGKILGNLLNIVIENPEKNEKDNLLSTARELYENLKNKE